MIKAALPTLLAALAGSVAIALLLNISAGTGTLLFWLVVIAIAGIRK